MRHDNHPAGDSPYLNFCESCGESFPNKNLWKTGRRSCICRSCLENLYHAMLNEEQTEKEDSLRRFDFEKITPSSIKASLDAYVIGQDHAKKVLAVAAYNHYKRICAAGDPARKSGVEMQKSNILMAGPTGSGKTLLAQTLAKAIDVPLAIADATSLTQAGYIGDDVESVLSKLLLAAGGDIELAQRGIVFIDEIDKLACRCDDRPDSRDISGGGVQQGLLKLMEGTVASVPKNGVKKASSDFLKIDTSQILFICGGAFADMDRYMVSGSCAADSCASIGFEANIGNPAPADEPAGNILRTATTEDFVRYGLMPEFIGRLPITIILDDPDASDLVRILKEPKNALVRQYQELLRYDNVNLVFEKAALEEIALIASEKKTGARGLRSIMETLMLDIMYEAPEQRRNKKIVITRRRVRKQFGRTAA